MRVNASAFIPFGQKSMDAFIGKSSYGMIHLHAETD
jgi:hypothetical protein